MDTVYFDPTLDDERRRAKLYDGQLFAFSPRASTLALVEFARELIEEAFHPLNPREAQFMLPVAEFAGILATLKPRFTNHPTAKRLLVDLLCDFGYDPHKTYFDVPKMRSMAHGDYLKAGIALPFHPHRDTWYASPMCQQNWWIPIYEIESACSMAFHPRYWSEPIQNSSSAFNQYEWNKTGRRDAAKYLKQDTRKQPRAEQPLALDPQVRIVTRAGGPILFSGAQLHSTVPNTSGSTRFSLDFRTVHLDDVAALRGAPNLDSAATGTTLWEYLRADDLSRIPKEIIRHYDPDSPATEDGLIFEPVLARSPR